MPPPTRPTVGFILEGRSEHVAYPALVAKIIPGECNVPRVNAKGNGGVIKELEQHLYDICTSKAPRRIIVALDLREAIQQKIAVNCVTLRQSLQQRATVWLNQARTTDIAARLPDEIIVVIQVQEFETWILSDPQALRDSGLLEGALNVPANIDEQIAYPYNTLRNCLRKDVDPKQGDTAKQLLKNADPERMCQSSRSFRKLVKEIRRAYGLSTESL